MPDTPPYIRGAIVDRDSTMVWVESTTPGAAAHAGPRRAGVGLGARTRLVWRDGAPAPRRALAAGRVVAVWITGAVDESDPPHVEATVIVVEPAP